MGETLLIVDDEADIRAMLRDAFSLEGYRVLTAASGEEALTLLERRPDLVLLDVSMPGMDGLDFCRRVRDFLACPILFLTARVEERDKLAGFSAGGDDYVSKPFAMQELSARVAAHLRRESRRQHSAQVRFAGELTIDYSQRAAWVAGEAIPLAKKEFDILELLTLNSGQTFDRERIYERIWGYEGEGDSAVVTEHVRRLRAKLAAASPGLEKGLETVWGVGYKWVG